MRRVEGIPQKLLICGETWPVVCTKHRPKWVKLDAGEVDAGIFGECNASTKTIWVRNTGNVEDMQRTLCHEIMHALLFESFRASSGVDIAVGCNLTLQEQIADSIESPLLQFLRDNDHGWARVRRSGV